MDNWKPKSMTAYKEYMKINSKVPFNSIEKINEKVVKEVFEFAYQMAYEKKHKENRSEGKETRAPNQIFVNAFSGKISEFAVFNLFQENGVKAFRPDLNVYERGKWDTTDLTVITSEKKEKLEATIKSTKSIGNLLLLETKDWDFNGNYKYSNKEYSFFIFVILETDLESKLKKDQKLYSDLLSKPELKKYIKDKYNYDIPGFLLKNDIKEIISKKQIIHQNTRVNSKNGRKMDVSNYYVQSGNMRNISVLLELLKRL